MDYNSWLSVIEQRIMSFMSLCMLGDVILALYIGKCVQGRASEKIVRMFLIFSFHAVENSKAVRYCTQRFA